MTEVTKQEIREAVEQSQTGRENVLTGLSVEDVSRIMQIRPKDHSEETINGKIVSHRKVYKRVLFLSWNKRGRHHIRNTQTEFVSWNKDFTKYNDVGEITEQLNKMVQKHPGTILSRKTSQATPEIIQETSQTTPEIIQEAEQEIPEITPEEIYS